MLTNSDRDTVLYIGITNNLAGPAGEHSLNSGSAFARQYNAYKRIHFEAYPDASREKQLKRWSRTKKDAVIARTNRERRDLFDERYALQPVGGNR